MRVHPVRLLLLSLTLATCGSQVVVHAGHPGHAPRVEKVQECSRLLRMKIDYAEALKLYFKRARLSLKDPAQSEQSKIFLTNMLRLKIPVGDDSNLMSKGDDSWEPSWVWDRLAEIQAPFFVEYPQVLIGVSKLAEPNLTRAELNQLVKDLSGAQVKPVFFEDLRDNQPSQNRYGEIIGKDGNLVWSLFFSLIASGQLPVFDHHDLLGHLGLWSIPSIASATDQYANFVTRVARSSLKAPFAFQDMLNMIWFSMQEKVWFFDRDAKGRVKEIVPIGGFTALETSEMARATYATKLGELGPFSEETFRQLLRLYEQVYHPRVQIKRKGPHVLALKAKLKEWRVPHGVSSREASRRSHYLDEMAAAVEECIARSAANPWSKTGYREAQMNLGQCWAKHISPKYPYLRQFETLDGQAEFWRLHMSALEEMVFD